MKKKYTHVAFSLTVFAVLTSCMSMMMDKKIQEEHRAQEEQLEMQIEQYGEMPFDETIAARFVGTWRNVNFARVTVYSFSGDGSMTAAVRQFAGGNPDNFMSGSYKVSKDMVAQRFPTGFFPGENPDQPVESIFFYSYQFNDDYSEITFDLAGFGLEFGTVFTKIDDKYTDTISAASLDMPMSAAQNALLFFGQVWQQPNEIAQKNKGAEWTARFRVDSVRVNDKEFGPFPAIGLLEGEYKIYFGGTITFQSQRVGRDPRELPISKTFYATLNKGHIYEIKVYVEPMDMYLALSAGPDQHSTFKTAVLLTERE
jgi:hypothetical protein